MAFAVQESKREVRYKMKWLEVIELRTSKSNREWLESQMLKLIDEVEKATQQQTIKSYRRVMVNTDFSIHLFHESEKVEKCGSELGLHLASAVKEYGLVNHRIWIETPSNSIETNYEDL
jgi:hypothetical protein